MNATKKQVSSGNKKATGKQHSGRARPSSASKRSIVVPATTSLRALQNLQVQPEDCLSNIVYHKSATTVFSVLLNSIPQRDSTVKPSYDIIWHLPGYSLAADQTDGIVAHLSHTVYDFENLSDFDVYMRVQRPMGYRADPSSVGMWEPIGHNNDLLTLVKPRSKLKFTVSNGSTSLMCPLHAQLTDYDGIHLLSFSAFREATNIHGVDYTTGGQHPGIGLQIGIETFYRCNNGSTGKQKNYTIMTHSDAKYLDYVRAGPVPSVRAADLSPPGSTLKYVYFGRSPSQDSHITIRMKIIVDGVEKHSNDICMLDKNLTYRLPSSLLCYYTANLADVSSVTKRDCILHGKSGVMGTSAYQTADSITWDAKNGEWLVCLFFSDNGEKPVEFTELYVYDYKKMPVIYPNEFLRPLNNNHAVPKVTSKMKKVNARPSISDGEKSLLRNRGEIAEASITSQVIEGLVLILDVINAASSFAAAFGLLSIGEQALAPTLKQSHQG